MVALAVAHGGVVLNEAEVLEVRGGHLADFLEDCWGLGFCLFACARRLPGSQRPRGGEHGVGTWVRKVRTRTEEQPNGSTAPPARARSRIAIGLAPAQHHHGSGETPLVR